MLMLGLEVAGCLPADHLPSLLVEVVVDLRLQVVAHLVFQLETVAGLLVALGLMYQQVPLHHQ